MSVEFGLELMAVVRSHLADAEREFVDDGVDEVDRVRLIVAVIDLQGANARGIVDRRVLVALDGLPVFPFEFQELDVDLDLMTRHLFLVSLSVDLANTRAAGQPAPTRIVANASIIQMQHVSSAYFSATCGL
jgi:hypothetical protein